MTQRALAILFSIFLRVHCEEYHEVFEVSLLQNEVKTRARGGSKRVQVETDPLDGKESICDSLAAEAAVGATWSGKEDMPQQHVQLTHSQPREPPRMQPEASETGSDSAAFVYVLDVLIVAVCCDGLRRWNKSQKATTAKVASSAKGCQREGSDDWDALMTAALAGNLEQSEILLRKSMPLGKADVWGCTVLHAAAKGGCAPLVKILLERRAAGIDRLDAWDETPLHIAARAGHIEVSEALLAHGARINAMNAQDWTPLLVAADAMQEDVCRLLLDRGATVGDLTDDVPSMLRQLQAVSSNLDDEAEATAE